MWTIIKTLASTALSFVSGGGVAVYLACAGVGLVGGFLGGWNVNGWRWEAREASLVREYDAARDKAVKEARDREAAWALQYAALDEKYTKEKASNEASIARLRADVDAGRKRLLVRAACPTAPAVPKAPGGSGVVATATAELTGDARQAYFDLVGQHDEVIRMVLGLQEALNACQSASK